MPVKYEQDRPRRLPGRRPPMVHERYVSKVPTISNFDEMHRSIVEKFRDNQALMDAYFGNLALFEEYFGIRHNIALGIEGSSQALNDFNEKLLADEDKNSNPEKYAALSPIFKTITASATPKRNR